jgi:hypothetical protein
MGAGMDWLLIVAGLDRGHVWWRDEYGAQPCEPWATFLDWHERWLDNRPFKLGWSRDE